MLATIGLVVLVLWLIGLIAHIGGVFVNLLLILGVILLAAHLLRGRTHHNTL